MVEEKLTKNEKSMYVVDPRGVMFLSKGLSESMKKHVMEIIEEDEYMDKYRVISVPPKHFKDVKNKFEVK